MLYNKARKRKGMKHMNIKAAIWDLDGTLLNTLDDLAASTNAAMRRTCSLRYAKNSFISASLHDIAHAELRCDKAVEPRGVELLSQSADVYGQGVFINEAVGLPQLFH